MRPVGRAAGTADRVLLLAAVWAVLSVLLGFLGAAVHGPAWLLWPAGIGAAATSAYACRVAAADALGAARVFWRRMMIGLFVLTTGTVEHASRTLLAGHPTSMDLFAATCYISAVACAVHAMLRLPRAPRSWRANLANFLDVAVVGVAGSLVTSHFLSSTAVPASTGTLAAAMSLIVLITACAATLAVIRVGVMGAGPVHGPALWFLAPIGLLAPASWMLTPWTSGRPYLSATAMTMIPLGLMFAFAARSQVRAQRRPAQPVDQRRARRWRGISVVPIAAITVTAVLLVSVTLRLGYLPADLAGGSVVLTTLVVIRQLAALSDNTRLTDQLQDQANHDDLTGLPNRRMFAATLHRRTAPATVAVCDLDGFGILNDRLGDERGDALLRAAAARITETFGADAFVARLLGDEFGVLIPGDQDHQGERLVRAFRLPLQVDGHDLLVTVTVGVAAGRDEVVPDLLRRAELALKAAKRAGANHHQEHTADLDQTAQHDADLASALRRGLDMGEFQLAYQPIVELPGGRITGVEALIRWYPDGGDPVSPVEFIPIAEQTGLILDLGLWVIETACADAARWQQRHGADAPRVNINVSARQLLDPDLPDQVAATMARYRLDPEKITLEITETAVFGGGAALNTVRELRDLGVGVALDDFGTGQSSLTLLRTCPVTTLKVDKSFIDELNGTAEQEAIATSLSTIAATLGLRAVAEGVETQAQAVRLEALGYRYAQGYYFARPGPAALIDTALDLQHAVQQ
ncbi:putative bifunctional diguanylate cyclase/phosphodiesterase [Actinoplanes palleronii]|uniref:putative bifunctional diguanylate cyclase/phosphodiesterase n=1 Tax=Actinoplanes palleronii TaxID=113570 RepID=UPI0019427213|nr:bifunctional diguanylate cyclase/phosphodiesterase [Actinoplanes palleronii]